MSNEVNKQAWLKERKSGIGGSDVAAILGLSKWRSPVDVWMDKTGRSNPPEESEAMWFGTQFEDIVAKRYEQETGRKVQRINKMLHNGCLLGNIDRLVMPDDGTAAAYKGDIRTDRLLECKTSSNESDWTDGVPEYYRTQVLHYMGLAPTVQFADVAVYFSGLRKFFKVYTVERNDSTIKAMQDYCKEWWEKYVVADVPPAPESEDDCKNLWKKSNGKSVALEDADIAVEPAVFKDKEGEFKVTAELLTQVIADLKRYTADEKELKKRISRCKGILQAYIRDAESLTVGGKVACTWKLAAGSSSVDWERIAREKVAGVDAIIPDFTEVKEGVRKFLVK